jgi:hypothetical protein
MLRKRFASKEPFMNSDLTSKLAAAGLELSKANEEKLDLVFDIAMSQLQDEMRSQTDDELQFARNKLNAAELERSNIAAISLKSFENALARYKMSVEQSEIQNQTSTSNVEQAAQKFIETAREREVNLFRMIQRQEQDLEEKSKDLIKQFAEVKKHYAELKRWGWLVMGGMVIAAVLVVLVTGTVAAYNATWAMQASKRATEAQERAQVAQESLKATNTALEDFQRDYGLKIGRSKGGLPMFILEKGKRMKFAAWQGTVGNRINGWIVE